METAPPRPQRIRLLGQAVDLVTPDQVLAFIGRTIDARAHGLVANHNLHSLYLTPRTPGMRAIYDAADLIEIDSTPMLLWGKLTRKSTGRRHRCTYLDWREAFWTLAAARGWRVYYLGGAPGVAAKAMARLQARWPGAVIGGRDGYFNAAPGSDDNTRVLGEIAGFAPDVLMVGMGMPRQELWVAHHYAQLGPCVVLPVGAAFDYEAGVQTPAPRWMGRMGLEWAFRLVSAPGRLAARYLVEPWSLIPAAITDLAEAYGPKAASPGQPTTQSSP